LLLGTLIHHKLARVASGSRARSRWNGCGQ
jgi:hypothetical protein